MKKGNIAILTILVVAVLYLAGYDRGRADAQATISPAKVGVVNINAILQTSRKHKQWQEQMGVEDEKVQEQFKTLESELRILDADLKTRAKGSADYVKLLREFEEKKSMLDIKNKFYQDEVTAKVKDWTEKIYQEIEGKVEEVARKKGLDLVLAKDTVEIPSVSMRELLLSIKTNEVMYHNKQMDITADVLSALDAGL